MEFHVGQHVRYSYESDYTRHLAPAKIAKIYSATVFVIEFDDKLGHGPEGRSWFVIPDVLIPSEQPNRSVPKEREW